MRLRPIIFSLLGALVAVRAAEPLAPPAPLVTTATMPAPGGRLESLDNARRMLALGISSVAAGAFEKLLAAPDTPATERNALVLDLVSARLNAGDTAAAAKALQGFTGPTTAAYQLRAGLIAARQGRFSDARTALTAARPEELVEGERAWVYFLQGMLADAVRDYEKALAAYGQAMNVAASPMQRARFVVARELARLNTGDVSEAKAAEALANAQSSARQDTGYIAAHEYAAEMFALGHKAEAAAYVQGQLRALPAAARVARDDFRLLLGLFAGAADGAGRDALEGLLTDADNRDLQSAALQLLAEASQTGSARDEFKLRLTALIGATSAHPALADLLLMRAQLGLAEKTSAGYAQAEDDANELLKRFSTSQLFVPAARGTLLDVAWEKRQFRAAADQADKARAALPPEAGGPRAELGVLKAEAWFRAGEADGDANNFRNAAAAYAEALLAEPPAGITTGALIFQQALALIRAGARDDAGKLLDSFIGDLRLDAASRWQAEWNLARAYQAAGNPASAYARVNALLAAAPTSGTTLTGDLRARMAWLQTRLALDTDTPEHAIALAQALVAALPGMTGLEDNLGDGVTLRDEVAASTRLLQALAGFAVTIPPGEEPARAAAETARDAQALALLGTLREEFPKTDAALRSYLEEAAYYARPKRDGSVQIVRAQDLLQQLADKFPDGKSPTPAELFYAPTALFQKALLEELRGQEENRDNAFKTLDLLLFKYPQSDLVFSARQRQGELLIGLNKFPEAQQIYELLVHDFAQHPYANWAKLALANCHYEQVARDASHYGLALAGYTELQFKADAAPELRAEAGFKRGLLLAHDHKDEAVAVWMAHALAFLPPDPAKLAPGTGWREPVANSLLHAADLLAEDGSKLSEAVRAYNLIIENGLPYALLARDRLDRLGGVAPAK